MQNGEEHKIMLIIHALVAYAYRVNHRCVLLRLCIIQFGETEFCRLIIHYVLEMILYRVAKKFLPYRYFIAHFN